MLRSLTMKNRVTLTNRLRLLITNRIVLLIVVKFVASGRLNLLRMKFR